MEKIRLNQDMQLQIMLKTTDQNISMNVMARVQKNGEYMPPLFLNISTPEIVKDGSMNFYYIDLYGDSEDLYELVAVSLTTGAAILQAGTTFSRIGIISGSNIVNAFYPFKILFSGHLTSSLYMSYPASGIKRSDEGRGNYKDIVVSVPSSGEIVSYEIPMNTLFKLSNVTFELVTSAVVSNRLPYLQIKNMVGSYVQYLESGINQPATTTYKYFLMNPGFSIPQPTGNPLYKVISGFNYGQILTSGHFIEICAYLLDTDDQFQNIIFSGEEWVY